MRLRLAGMILCGGMVFDFSLVSVPPAQAEEAKKAAKITYEEQVSAIFKNRCNGCHNADKQKGGLNLETFGTSMQGGGSGKVIEPGELDASTLFQLVSHKDEPSMPPNAPKIPEAEIEVIKLWIEGGALETSGSVAVVKARPKFEFKVDPSAAGRPSGEPATPKGLSVEPAVVAARPTAITALAAGPWAAVVAVGGHKQVLLYDSGRRHLVGVLPFPEGTVHVLKFSRNGSLLLAGGGRGGQSGLAVVWDVTTGKRVFQVGKEYDAVLAADISADHGLVALGGPSKVLRVYNTADGELVYQSKKHTEWVTAVEFSPDGVLLASGDRNNGLLVWEAATGREFYDLRGHTAAITDISWRPDSNVVASASEDGTIRLWEMENGKQVKSLTAHAGGVASVRYTQDGRLVSTGRDRVARLWDTSGNKVRDFEPFADLALEAVVTHDNALVVAGDWTGEVRVWDIKDGRRLGNLSANPASLAVRVEQNRKDIAAASAALKSFEPVQKAAAEKTQAVAQCQRDLAEAERTADRLKNDLAAAEKAAKANADEDDSATKALGDLREAARQAAALVPVRKTAVDKASAERAAADKALSSAKPAIDAAASRLQALQQEADALAADEKEKAGTQAQEALARSPGTGS
jgi:hypothetical protein